MEWRRSTYSNPSGNCVEVACDGGRIHVRDSKNPDGGILTFTPGGWRAFIDGLRHTEDTSV